MSTVAPEEVLAGLRALLSSRLEDALEADEVEIQLELEPACRVAIRSPYVAELDEEVLPMFFELEFYTALPSLPDYRMIWDWHARRRDGSEQTYHVDSAVALLPDSGGFTAEQWAAFAGQFTYAVNGEKKSLPEPESFLEE